MQHDRQSWLVPQRFGPRGPLYFHQANLPRLPLPSLEETCVRYLRSVRPLATEEEFKKTQQFVLDFLLGGTGEQLQKKLQKHVDEKNKFSSWFIDWWNDVAYFEYRDPVVFNVSYFFQYKPNLSAFSGLNNTARAAKLVTAALKFRQMIIDETLPPEPSRLGPASCSSMYSFMFNACRVPCKGKDFVDTFAPSHSHVVVVRNGYFYAVDVFHADGTALTTGEIDHQFKHVISLAEREKGPRCGALTADNRDRWAENRNHLIAVGNSHSLNAIENSILLVCLDTENPENLNQTARMLWHGNGYNRWYDKPVQFIVAENGKCGFLGEHSVMDGTPLLNMNNWCLGQLCSNKIKCDLSPPKRPLPPPRHLVFVADDKIQKAIETAQNEFHQTAQDHDLHVLQFTHFGKNGIKNFGISPDAFAQLAIQLANYRMIGKFVATYESCSTRSFLHGRTEVIRSCTSASKDFVLTMTHSPPPPHETCLKALEIAANQHIAFAAKAAVGNGVDRHLLGLRKMRQPQQAIPMFEDAVFSRANHWRLSTSALASEFFDAWGFGEVVPDGFGIGYMVNNDQINFTVTSRKLGAEKMCQLLAESLDQMASVCVGASQQKAKL